MNRWIVTAAVAAIGVFDGTTAGAQITTVVSPPRRVEIQRAQEERKAEVAAQDSVARVTMTGMKEWVDSAASALAIRPDTGVPAADSARRAVAATDSARAGTEQTAATATGRPSQADTTRSGEQQFRDGARAPDTATAIPTLAVAGAALLLVGAALRRRRG